MIRRILCLASVALCLVLGGATALAQGPSDLWTQATEAAGAGNDAKAVEILTQLAKEFPSEALADDALFLAGNLLEEKLGMPREAQAQYQELLTRFPNARTALAAKRRLERLDAGLGESGQGADVLVAFQAILRGFPDRSPQESVRMAKGLVAKYPSWPQLHEVHLWLAATTRRSGDLAEASTHYASVLDENAPEDVQVQALLGLTEVAILRGHHAMAEQFLETLEGKSGLSASDGHAVAELWDLLASSRQRKTLLWASTIAFVLIQLLFLALLWRTTRSRVEFLRALRRPTTEFYYMLPGAVLLVLMALTGHQEIGPAVMIICAGGLITTYLVGAWLQACKPVRTSHALLAAAASVVATVGACYFALQRSQLLDLVATTVRFGPE